MLCLLNHRRKLEGRRHREKEEYWHERLRAHSPKGLGDVEMKQRVDLGSLVSILRAGGGHISRCCREEESWKCYEVEKSAHTLLLGGS